MFAAASAMVFLGPQPPPMPPPAAAAPDLDDPLDPSSAGGGGGWGAEEAVGATAAGGVRKDNEHNRGEKFNVGLSSPPLASPRALFGSAEGGFAALGAADGGQGGADNSYGQPGGHVEFRRGSSTSPPADMLLSSGSPTSRSPVGGGRGGGGPSVFSEVGWSCVAGVSSSAPWCSAVVFELFSEYGVFRAMSGFRTKQQRILTVTFLTDRELKPRSGVVLEPLGSPAHDNLCPYSLIDLPLRLRLLLGENCCRCTIGRLDLEDLCEPTPDPRSGVCPRREAGQGTALSPPREVRWSPHSRGTIRWWSSPREKRAVEWSCPPRMIVVEVLAVWVWGSSSSSTLACRFC